jgi:DNA-binding SARP family transcriptional activator/tetratricopeptide (TPR) repeat protein
MDFRILGPLEVLDEGRLVALGGSKQRALLGVLLLHANETLSTDRLIDELWPLQPPATAAKTVQVHVSRLRKALAGDGREGPIATRAGGYRLEVDPERIDARRYERLVADARSAIAADRPAEAAAVLAEARGMWRGPPLADLSYEPFAQGEIARLADLRLAAHELQVEARLALGAHAEVIGELEALIVEHPYRERLRGQLMLALYRCDRQAEALQAFQDARRALVEELGIEPGERLRELERAVLAQDPALALPEPSVPGPSPAAVPPARSERRLISILAIDLLGPSGIVDRLDPESLHALLDRCAELCAATIERHGGTLEAAAGDAVIGAFGLAELHEDDALRAARAAHELLDCAGELGLERPPRIGLDAGEVFLSPGTRRPATGGAFASAARLQAWAASGEVLLGAGIRSLLGDAVHCEAVAGGAWRLLSVEREERAATPFLDREQEFGALRDAFAGVREGRICHAVSVIGPPGIGKSRLVAELAAALEGEATVAVGRCLAYGEGVAYRPLQEIAAGLGELESLLEGEGDAARLVLGATGRAEVTARADETFWALRRLLERAATRRPVVAVVEDVHWAEPTLLDLVEYLVAFSGGHPILLVCLARPELVELRPQWMAPQAGRSTVVLGGLPVDDARRLVSRAGLGPRTAARIVERADGNPLFLEQLAAVGGEGELPGSIHAVLAARIARLGAADREVLEHAAVLGEEFEAGAVAALLPPERAAGIAGPLASLARQGLVRADRAAPSGRDVLRFAHALIRDAAYRGVPKQERAQLHERAADWLEGRPDAPDETVGHHLAEAVRLLGELGRPDDGDLATRAVQRLGRAADGALRRGDAPAAARLLERAVGLPAAGAPAREELLPLLGAALREAGRLKDAERILSDAIDAAPPDGWLRARCGVERGLVRLQTGTAEDADEVAASALTTLARRGDDVGQSRALFLRGLYAWVDGRALDADGDWRRAAELAERAADEAALFEVLSWPAWAALFGPAPVDDAIAQCEDLRQRLRGSPIAAARILHPLAALHAMAGRFGEADALVREGDRMLSELGDLRSVVGQDAAMAELRMGRSAAAETRLRRGCAMLEEMDEQALFAATAAMLARVLCMAGRDDEADELCARSEAAAAEDDLTAQVLWRGVRARLLAQCGNGGEATALAEEAVQLAERTDFITVHADALLDLAVVLDRAGPAGRASAAYEAAADLYMRKGDVVSAARARDDHRLEANDDGVLERPAGG